MEEKLNRLYIECIKELNMVGIDILDEKYYGKIDISIAKRNNKRYGCCRQEEPDKRYKAITKRGRRKIEDLDGSVLSSPSSDPDPRWDPTRSSSGQISCCLKTQWTPA